MKAYYSEFDKKKCARHWENGIWIDCPDGKQRLVEPGVLLLVDGCAERVALIHAAGDAIVAPLAAEFIKALMGFRFCKVYGLCRQAQRSASW